MRCAPRHRRGKSFVEALREFLLAIPQVRRFFVLIVCTFIGTLAQDVLLEPYGALVLGMTVSETTQLTAWVGRRRAALDAAVLGCPPCGSSATSCCCASASWLTIAVFAGVIGAGLSGSPGAFRVLVAVMGLGTGLAVCRPPGRNRERPRLSVRAGLLMGVWGMASLLGKAAGSIMGGAVVDAIRVATGEIFLAYAAVFAGEAILLAVAFFLTFRLRVEVSRASREAQVHLRP